MADEMTLTVFDPIRALTVKVQEEDAALEVDHTTAEGEKELRSWVRTVRGYRAGLEKIRVKAKADALEYGRKVDGVAKELKSPFDEIIDARMKPLDEIEETKRKAAEAIVEAERVEKEKAETERLADLARREKVVADKEAANKAIEDAATAKKAEADQKARETQIALDATGKATKDAEAKAAAAANQKELDRLDEIENEKAVARMDAEVERKRIADVEHRASVEADIVKALFPFFGANSATARNIIAAINSGDIPHVTINY